MDSTVVAEANRWAMPDDYGDIQAEYGAARQGAALLDTAAMGKLALEGRDRAALLQRMSTNDVASLKPGQGVATILTNPSARIIERLLVYAEAERLWALTAPMNRHKVFNYLKRHIFFMDQVTLGDRSDEVGLCTVIGPQAAATLSRIAGMDVSPLPLHHHLTAQVMGVAVSIARTDRVVGDGFHVLVARAALPTLWEGLAAAGARPIGWQAWNILRVEAGLALAGFELTEEFNPVDLDLLQDIHTNKGCYTGQEVIARMINYDKRPKGLFGLRLQGDVPPLPAGVEADGKSVGVVTSAVRSPRLGPIALAVLRHAQAPVGATVQVVHAGRRIPAEVIRLPFPS